MKFGNKLRTFVFSIALLLPFHAQAGDPILKPVLRSQADKASTCLESVMRLSFTPGETIAEWRGPGVRADSTGAIDPSTALYVFRLQPTNRWLGLAFYSEDEDGWRIFSYTENNKLLIGYRAASMESTGYLFGVKPRDLSVSDSDEQEYEEIDLSPCRDLLSLRPN